MFLHCKKCYIELPDGMSPKEYANNEVEVLPNGTIYISCARHNLPIVTLKLDMTDRFTYSVANGGCSCEKCKGELNG